MQDGIKVKVEIFQKLINMQDGIKVQVGKSSKFNNHAGWKMDGFRKNLTLFLQDLSIVSI